MIIIKFLKEDSEKESLPFAVVKDIVKPGDMTFNGDNIIVQANQSTCILFDYIVIGPANKELILKENEQVDIYFDCKLESKYGYPFCGSQCQGNKESFRINGKEERNY